MERKSPPVINPTNSIFNENKMQFIPFVNNDKNVNKPMIISIEGNIGAGKSTLLAQISDESSTFFENTHLRAYKFDPSEIVCMQEPVGVWESVKDPVTGESILQLFYKDPLKYAFAFQVMAYTSRLETFRRIVAENPDCKLILCERSLEADSNIFAKMMRADGMIDEVSYQVYKTLYDATASDFALDGVYYLDVAPEVCLERIAKRAREGESGITLEYLEKCDKYHREWLKLDPRRVG
jgi:deoxyadenosine/deoxycytidine kinase